MRMVRVLYSLVQKIHEYKYNHQTSLGNIYMFHQVNNDTRVWRDYSCCISLDGFRCFIDELLKSGTVFKSVGEFCTDKKEKTFNVDCVIITFDDAYDDVYYNCYPILKEKGIPFTVFITYDLLGEKGYLSCGMVAEMLHSGLCTLGAHTITHNMLRKQSKAKVEYEFRESKRLLSEKFNTHVDTMAYPYGSCYACSRANIKMCQKTGYLCSFSTLNCQLTHENISKKYFIPRRNINEKNYREMLNYRSID